MSSNSSMSRPNYRGQQNSHFHTLTLFLNNVRTVIRVINKASLSHLVRGLIAGVLQCQVHHGVLEGAAHVELKGDVVHTLQFGQKGRNHIHSQKLSGLHGCFSVFE